MDANLAALLTVVVTSLTSIIIALITMKKVDKGNAMTDSVHTTVNGNNAALQQRLEAAQQEIARLNRALPPDDQ